ARVNVDSADKRPKTANRRKRTCMMFLHRRVPSLASWMEEQHTMLPSESAGRGSPCEAIPGRILASQRRSPERNYSQPGCAAINPIERRIQDFMQALIVVDAQNEFSPEGLRAVPGHERYLKRIQRRVQEARQQKQPIAWVRHYNRPHESRAFVPGTWGSELSPGLGPQDGFGPEKLFEKDVFGAF